MLSLNKGNIAIIHTRVILRIFASATSAFALEAEPAIIGRQAKLASEFLPRPAGAILFEFKQTNDGLESLGHDAKELSYEGWLRRLQVLSEERSSFGSYFNMRHIKKILLGLLQPEECLILASHLIDEMKNFVSRVVLLKGGRILDDKSTEELDQEGLELVAWMKQLYGYENRAAQFIERAERELK